MKLIVREQHGAALIAIDLWVRGGSGRERPDESGAAHFLEHLIFKGTPTRKPGEIDGAFEDLGTSLSAGTARDGSHFYSTFSSGYLTMALDVLADAVRNASLAPEEVERERLVILDEMARGRNDWRKLALDRLWSALYPGTPYGRPILGLVESLKRLSRDRVAGYHARLFGPSNSTLVIVGDVDPDTALAATTKAFGSWEKRDSLLPELLGSKSDSSVTSPIDELFDGTSGVVAIGFRAPPGVESNDVCAADVLTALLGDPRAGRLREALRANASEAGADFSTHLGPGVFAVYAAVNPARIADAQRALEAEIRRLQTDSVDPGELEFAKRSVIGAYLYDIETYGGQARALGLYDTVSDHKFAMEYAANVNKVAAKDIKSFAAKYLIDANRVVLVLRPKGK